MELSKYFFIKKKKKLHFTGWNNILGDVSRVLFYERIRVDDGHEIKLRPVKINR